MATAGEVGTIKRLAIHPPNWLGDAIMAQPAMRAFIDAMHPEALTLVGKPWLAELAPWLNLGDTRTSTTMPTDAESVVLFPNSIRVAWAARQAGIPQRIGFRGQWRRWLLTDAPCPQIDMMHQHHRDYFLDLAEQCGITPATRAVELSIPNDAITAGERLLQAHDLHPARTIAIAPGAQFGGAKRYPTERYQQIAAALHAEEWHLLVIGTNAERAIGDRVVAEQSNCWNSAGETSLTQALQLIIASRLLLCNDSGLMHVAAGIGKPVVAIFGATDPKRTAPDGANTSLIYHPAPCSPCLQRECTVTGHPCMAAVSPDAVLERCQSMLIL
ncbi:MAG: lipopolysaccharide heptosyltransferase II [Mariprofundales bacterium]|nr:lipopolysaccharide heptosyltransferase II [Mariprofundales bacterium]